MAQIRAYKLYASGVATASAVSNLTIPRNGLITSIQWNGVGVSGAAGSSGIRSELSTSSVSTIAQNDTPGNSLSTFSYGSNVASTTMQGNLVATNLGIPVNAGDKLYIHQTTIGTAPNTSQVECTFTVMH